MQRKPSPSKYQPIVDWLLTLPAEQGFVRLTLAEIERIIGQALPLTARTRHGYWRDTPMAQRSWLSIGFSARLNLHDGGSVTFTRLPA
jgi:hypothetical protein